MIDYTNFLKLITDCEVFVSFEDFAASCKPSHGIPVCEVAKSLDTIWQMGHGGLNIKSISTACGRSMRNISQSYGIPYRTIQNWSEGNNSTPSWTLTLLAYAIFSDMF